MMSLFIKSNISNKPDYQDRQVVFIEVGQSNMVGRDGDTNNPKYPFNSTIGAASWNGSELIQLNTQRSPATGGCQSNYFADEIYRLCKIQAIIASCATGASGLTNKSAGGHNNWSATGTLRGATEAKVSEIINSVGALPMCGLWCQGEQDAYAMDNSEIYPPSTVKAAMQSVIDWWQSTYSNTPFLISQTGRPTNGDTQGYEDMRAIQQEIVDENINVYMAFTGAVNFPNEGKMSDNVHYNYNGYKEMGEAFANKYFEIL